MILSLSIGANLGRRAWALREAIRRIAGLPGTRLLGASSFYETAPWGKTDQPPFLNGAVQVETTLSPEAFLHQAQAIECDLGRVRHEHWGARTIDIDLVYATGRASAADGAGWGDDVRVIHRDTDELKLPHPYLLERAFVLDPLAEIAPDMMPEGHSITSWCEKNAGQGVEKTNELADPWPLQMIACVSKTRGIGKDGKLLFHIPEDMDFFKRQTKTDGSVVIMGRRTWESLPHALCGRLNIVLSRSHGKGTLSVFLEQLWRDRPGRPFWVIGGGEMYRALLPYTRRVLLTEVDAAPAADTFFPALDGFDCIKKSPAQTAGVMFAEYLRKNICCGT